MTYKQTILILEDLQKNTTILSSLLQDEYELIFSHNVQGAINILTYFEVDIILLNIKVPLLENQDYFKKLKAEAEIYQIPIFSIANLLQPQSPIPELRIMNHMVYF
jgi:response regulator RpfG family c-di-GMP phosphodiesterase